MEKIVVAWRLKDEEASEFYGKDIYVYYDKNDFQEGIDPLEHFIGLEELVMKD